MIYCAGKTKEHYDKKNIVSAKQVENIKELLGDRSKMPLNNLKIIPKMQEFIEKKDHAKLYKLQYGIIVKDKSGKVLVTFREPSENGKDRITSGHSVITSASSYEKAIEKLQNINLNVKNPLKEEVSINGMYIFVVRTYIIESIPLKVILNGTDKKAKAMSLKETVSAISEKSMELALIDENQEEQNPEEKIKTNTADLSDKDIQPI